MQTAHTRRCFAAAQRLLPIVFLLLVCGSMAAFGATKVVTDKDNGAKVQLKTGDVLEVELTSNPSTGYAWSVMTQSTPLLKQTSSTHTAPAQSGVGRPITQIFKFKTAGKGSGVLLLHYVRSWEQPSASDQQFKLNVTIE